VKLAQEFDLLRVHERPGAAALRAQDQRFENCMNAALDDPKIAYNPRVLKSC
jgi:hypothetical protein